MFVSYISSYNSLVELENFLLVEKLRGDMASAGLYFEKYYGAVHLEEGQLISDKGLIIGETHEMVDAISKDLNVVATVFVKNGDDYERVTTNITQENGQRALGTLLGKTSAAYDPVKNGRDYFGNALILGKDYLTVYRPLKDGNSVIGILFIGISKEQSAENIRLSSTHMLTQIVIITTLMLILAIILIYFISGSISRIFVNIGDILNKIARFDLRFEGNERTAGYIKRKDEVGLMTRSLALMQENLKELINKLKRQSRQINENSTNLAAVSEEQFASAEELFKQAQHIEGNAQNTAASIEQVTSGVGEMAVSAQDISLVAQELAEQISSTEKVVNNGQAELHTQQHMIESVGEQNKKAALLVTNVANKAENVQEIVNTISSIAEQTNLLALNAAIEAARAGTAGKGFAVVADEIRKLAEESKSASGTIEKILKTINISSVKANEAVKQTTDMFEGFREISGHLVNEFSQISKNMGSLTQRVETLTGSAEEQSASSEEMAGSMDVSAKSISEISDQIESMTAAVEQQENSSKQVSSSAEELNALVESLEEEINKFEL